MPIADATRTVTATVIWRTRPPWGCRRDERGIEARAIMDVPSFELNHSIAMHFAGPWVKVLEISGDCAEHA